MNTISVQRPIIMPQVSPVDIINELQVNLEKYSYEDLFNILGQDISPILKIIIRTAIRSKEKKQPFELTIEKAEKKLIQIETTRRKNFVRRTFKEWGLFAYVEIQKVYQDYKLDMLFKDLEIKKKKKKNKGIKPRFDFRAMQLVKYDQLYHSLDKGSREHNKVCERIAALSAADQKRKPLQLKVKLSDKETYLFTFHWNTDESKIKDFHTQANVPGISHDDLVKFRDSLKM